MRVQQAAATPIPFFVSSSRNLFDGVRAAASGLDRRHPARMRLLMESHRLSLAVMGVSRGAQSRGEGGGLEFVVDGWL